MAARIYITRCGVFLLPREAGAHVPRSRYQRGVFCGGCCGIWPWFACACRWVEEKKDNLATV